VCYREDPTTGMRVHLLRRWQRGEIPAQVMSESSGPKDYIANYVWSIFDRFPAIGGVWLVRGRYVSSSLFLLVQDADGRIFDMAGLEVEMKP
jgi:hypothetical protein